MFGALKTCFTYFLLKAQKWCYPRFLPEKKNSSETLNCHYLLSHYPLLTMIWFFALSCTIAVFVQSATFQQKKKCRSSNTHIIWIFTLLSLNSLWHAGKMQRLSYLFYIQLQEIVWITRIYEAITQKMWSYLYLSHNYRQIWLKIITNTELPARVQAESCYTLEFINLLNPL